MKWISYQMIRRGFERSKDKILNKKLKSWKMKNKDTQNIKYKES